MKWSIILPLLAGMCVAGTAIELSPAPVFQEDTHQFTGVALAKGGRILVNYHSWQSAHQYDVVEVVSNETVWAHFGAWAFILNK
jgi:hypothetical protein